MMPMAAYRPMVAIRKMKPIHSRGKPHCSSTASTATNRKKARVYQRYTLLSWRLKAALKARVLPA